MGRRGLIALVAAGCGAHAHAPAPPPTADQVVHDFETAVRTSREAFVAMFDFDVVGGYEILLRREYYLAYRDDMDDDVRAGYERDDGTPYPAPRERRNVGNFYPILGQRTVGSGGCHAEPVVGVWNRTIAAPHAPLPAGSEAWEPLRTRVNALLATGGVTDLRCTGGAGRLTLVWTAAASPRSYDLITIYDDTDADADADAGAASSSTMNVAP